MKKILLVTVPALLIGCLLGPDKKTAVDNQIICREWVASKPYSDSVGNGMQDLTCIVDTAKYPEMRP